MRRIGWKVLTEERERGRVKAIFLERVYFFFLIHIPMKVKTKRQKAFATMVTCAYEKYIYSSGSQPSRDKYDKVGLQLPITVSGLCRQTLVILPNYKALHTSPLYILNALILSKFEGNYNLAFHGKTLPFMKCHKGHQYSYSDYTSIVSPTHR